MINQMVDTPLGQGRLQGRFAVRDAHGELVTTSMLVRLPIDDITRSHLNQSNCLTPRARLSGLWVFQGSEVR